MTMTSTSVGVRTLRDVARHLVIPDGISASFYRAIEPTLTDLGLEHDDWQRDLGFHVLAMNDRGLFAAGVGGVVLSTCRQVGKTFTFGSIIFALCAKTSGTTVLWTAHHTRTSDETFEALAIMAGMPKVVPHIRKVLHGNGKQAILFKNGSRILFGAREQGFGRGIPAVSIIVFDEAQILSQRALNAMLPATNTVRNPLIIYMGTPPDPRDPSEVLKWRRRRALELEDSGDTSDMLYVEIGADPDAGLDDRTEWARGNPSYPDRTPDEAFLRLRAQLGDDGAFRREGLGIWDDDESASRAISVAQWDALFVESKPADGNQALGVAFSLDGMRLSLAGAIAPPVADDGTQPPAHVELIDAYAGSMELGLAPLADWMASRWRDYAGFVLSGRAGATVLADLLHKRKVPERRVIVLNTPQYLQSCAGYLDEIRAGTVTHLRAEGQVALDEAVAVTERRNRSKVDDAWSWWSADGSYVHLEAVSLALYGARTLKPPRRVDPSKPKGAIL